MPRILYLITLVLLTSACRRTTCLKGTWNGNDTLLYLTRYTERSFVVTDSIQTHDGQFLWEGHLDADYLYGLSPERKDRHPATFFPERDTLVLTLWKGGGIATQQSPLNDLLQRTLATDFRPDTLMQRHPDSPVTAYIALRYMPNLLNYDSLKALRPLITNENHPYVRELDNTLVAMRNIHPGAFAPVIEHVSFADTTLVVFHATWCPDCQEAWKDIRNHLATHPDWKLVALNIDSLGWNNDLCQAYAVCGVPAIYCVIRNRIQTIGLPLP